MDFEDDNFYVVRGRGLARLRSSKPNSREALEDLTKANMLKGGDAHVLAFRGEAKRLEQDLEGALKDSDKAHELQPKLVFILGMRALVVQQCTGNLLKEGD